MANGLVYLTNIEELSVCLSVCLSVGKAYIENG